MTGIHDDQEPFKTGHDAGAYARELPADVRDGSTGLACMDGFRDQLVSTGWLHNHARMWMAAWLVHWRRVHWKAGADWFLEHLLDGDPASNHLSWQWVASTFSHKPYFFNRGNLERYSDGHYCDGCPSAELLPLRGQLRPTGEPAVRPDASHPGDRQQPKPAAQPPTPEAAEAPVPPWPVPSDKQEIPR